MGKLFVRLIFFFCSTNLLVAQEALCVYKAEGTSLLDNNKTKVSLKKGGIIQKDNLVNVLPEAIITAIDNHGNTYNINVEGKYNFKNLLNFKVKQQSSNFTANYFKHIWEELTNSGEKKKLIAGVFRGDLLMTSPMDSCAIASSKITFKWQTLEDKKLYYFFLKNIKTEEIIKIETNGSQIALYNDIPIFYEGTTFEWAVSTDAFPNLDNIYFFGFELIDRNDYEEEKVKYKDFILDLKDIGIKEKEIEIILCEAYRLCK